MKEITRILDDLEAGRLNSAEQLLPAVYNELRKMAAIKLAQENAGQTLDATSLVHEAYLRLGANQSFESRRHFLGAASQAMRRILIDRARARSAKKRGGGMGRADLDLDLVGANSESDERLLALDEALQRFRQIAPEKAELVQLRYFAGLKIHEAAEVMGISTATADRNWAYARSWLQSELDRLENQ